MRLCTQFCFRNQPVSVNKETATQLEALFNRVRLIHNHYVTTFQRYGDSELKDVDTGINAMVDIVAPFLRSEIMRDGPQGEQIFIEGQIYASIDDWEAFKTKRLRRPSFKTTAHEQVLWVIDPLQIDLLKDQVVLPGIKEAISLPQPKIKVYGTPSLFMLRKQKDGRYWVTILYEKIGSGVQTHLDKKVGEWGEALCKLVFNNDRRTNCFQGRSHRQKRSALVKSEAESFFIRKAVLRFLIKPKPPVVVR